MGNNFVNRAQCLCALSHASILTYFQSCLDQYLSPPLSNANVSFICNTVRFSWDSLRSSIGSPDLLDGFLTLCILKFCLLFVCPTQSRPTLCDPMDCSPPGFSVHGILQARILDWVAMPFSRRSSQPRDWTQVSLIVGRFFTFLYSYLICGMVVSIKWDSICKVLSLHRWNCVPIIAPSEIMVSYLCSVLSHLHELHIKPFLIGDHLWGVESTPPKRIWGARAEVRGHLLYDLFCTWGKRGTEK